MKAEKKSTPARYTEGTHFFSGYNHCLRNDASEVYDCLNMTMDEYPFIATRPKRAKWSNNSHEGNLSGLNDALVADVISYGEILPNSVIAIKDGKLTFMSFAGAVMAQGGEGLSDDEKLVIMGGYVVCFPSGYYHSIFDIDGNDHGYIGYDIEFEVTEEVDGGITFSARDGNGAAIPKEEPSTPKDGVLWNDGGQIKKYSEVYNAWFDADEFYIHMTVNGKNSPVWFTEDTFKHVKENDLIDIYKEIDGVKTLACSNLCFMRIIDTNILCFKVTVSKPSSFVTSTGMKLHISHKAPKLDYVFEHNNRLWGCYYGIGEDGKPLNEIYASALGDFRNFYKYQGISTDAWTATVGTPGKWTGAISYGGYPTFFKENSIIRVYGDYPAAFSTLSCSHRGIAEDNELSLAIVDDVLYYNSPNGIVAYTGGVPANVDEPLRERFKRVVGGSYNGKYYASCERSDGSCSLFIYDTVKKCWIKEDDFKATKFISKGSKLHMFCMEGRFYADQGRTDDTLPWSITTAVLGLQYLNHKYVSRVQARVECDNPCDVYVSFDGGSWEHIGRYFGEGIVPILCNIPAHRCDYFQLKICGNGYAKILSLNYLIENGSENID